MTPNEARERAEAWLQGDPDAATRAETRALLDAGDAARLIEQFGASLEFGTAGLRGRLGAGPNRMNRAVVIRTTAGLAAYLLLAVPDAARRGVVVGHDARHMSREFAEDVAGVLRGAGLRVLSFAALASTPLVSFAVDKLKAAAGVMITASHNPAAYNGYKVYGPNAAQIVPPHDEGIARAILAAPPAAAVERAAALNIEPIGPELETAYYEGIAGLLGRALGPLPLAERAKEKGPSLRIVYTPLHGVGYAFARRAMVRAGFGELIAVPEQVEPDPEFPTVAFPNPEEAGVLDRALSLARAANADLVLANDPDADRLAVAVKNLEGQFVQLSGNQVGVLLGHYLLTRDANEGRPAPLGRRPTPRGSGDGHVANGKDSPHGAPVRAVVSTIVSSPMLGRIARDLGVRYEETLTGFKWIVDRALRLEQEGARVVLGYEEALGYSVGTLVRDKDGVSAAVAFAELTAACQDRRQSVMEYLHELYRRYGLYASVQQSVTQEGAEGARLIAHLMAEWRRESPSQLGARRVLTMRDYAAPVSGLPPSNVLAFELEGDTRVIIRPSGTEPKLKFYIDHREEVLASELMTSAEDRARQVLQEVVQAVDRKLHETMGAT